MMGKWGKAVEAVKYVAPAAVLFGLLWAVARPHAENFVNEAVEDRFVTVERHLHSIKQRQSKTELDLARMDEKLNQLNSVQQEMREDLKALLKSR